MIGYPHLERPDEFVAAVVTFATVTSWTDPSPPIRHPNGPITVRCAHNDPTPVIKVQPNSVRFPRPAAQFDEGR
jgi:hypothetical protein